MSAATVSIITPCLNEKLNVRPFYESMVRTFEQIAGVDFELIFVDDGSTDDTANAIKAIISEDPRCRLIIQRRNFGVYRSAFHALKYATGDAVIPLMPVDLQDPPEMIPKFVESWKSGNLVVAGQRYERDENFLMREIRRLYYRIVSKLADFDLPKYVGEFQLLDRSLVKELASIEDYYPYTRGLIASISSHEKREIIPYKWEKRAIGRSNMRFSALLDQGLNGLVSTSTAPLRGILIVNIFASLIGVFFGAFQVFAHFTFASAITSPGISTIIVLVSTFSALTFLTLAVLAEYVSAIHAQVRGRWKVSISELVNFPGVEK